MKEAQVDSSIAGPPDDCQDGVPTEMVGRPIWTPPLLPLKFVSTEILGKRFAGKVAPMSKVFNSKPSSPLSKGIFISEIFIPPISVLSEGFFKNPKYTPATAIKIIMIIVRIFFIFMA